MTIVKDAIEKADLKKVKFIFTENGKKVIGKGVEGPIANYYDMLTSVTKKNLFKIEQNFKNVLKIGFEWKEVHGIQFKQDQTRYRDKNKDRDVWSIVYTGETEFGDKVHYYRYEGGTAGAGNSWLYANGSSRQIHVSSFTDLKADMGKINRDHIFDWLCHNGIAKNITDPKMLNEIKPILKKIEALKTFNSVVGRKKIKPDYSRIEAVLFLISKSLAPEGGNTYMVGEGSREFLESTLEVEEPIEKIKDDSQGKTYVLKDGGQVRVTEEFEDNIYVVITQSIKEDLDKLKAKTILKIADYHRKQLEK